MDPRSLDLQRIADTEGTGRLANEQLLKVTDGRWGAEEPAPFRCECGNDACGLPLPVPPDVYERVRSDPMLFLVTPGHAVPEAEDVVERSDGYEVVRKHENVRNRVEASDPRTA
jgi:hypothetical protein